MSTSALALAETKALAECEAVIERGRETFIAVGQALLRIRDERLYRAAHKTFEDYCRDRWGWSRSHAYRQIEAAEVAENLSPIGDIPENESQARMLVGLPPETQREVWTKARQESNGRVTAKVLGELIREEVQARAEAIQPTSEERRRNDELMREMQRNSEYTHKVFNFIRAIETLSDPEIPLREAAREITKMDTPDKNWVGRAPLAERNLQKLIREMKP